LRPSADRRDNGRLPPLSRFNSLRNADLSLPPAMQSPLHGRPDCSIRKIARLCSRGKRLINVTLGRGTCIAVLAPGREKGGMFIPALLKNLNHKRTRKVAFAN
jgi:hypothetical protein